MAEGTFSDIAVWIRDVGSTARIISHQLKWLLVKLAPYILMPGILVATATGLITDDEIFAKAEALLFSLEGMTNTASGGMGPWLARLNYVFPMTELFILLLFVAQLAIASVAVRVIKAIIEFILEIIPF
ncbi:hypothetical protein DES53_102779 [Roseimicrobium gellanilyticum]|uniref:Uncharacterized protein n=1 Tax=Roseimicrobium gellanilyticum TaxID=748857 RepID=A0A366HTG7_9BACT|nr:hypothetical protein [Roseimicrobium gellanilyticum]RBP46388.1 hypothetical protein DES53_102779 [Roseimicrobium gellanilyticum]